MEDRIEVRVWEISKGVAFKDMFILILHEVNGDRKFPMLLTIGEAVGIIQELHGNVRRMGNKSSKEKITYCETMTKLLVALDVIVEHVWITDIEKGGYKSEVSIQQCGRIEKFVTNAADGILLALQTRCPLYIKPQLLEHQYFDSSNRDSINLPIQILDLELLQDALEGAIQTENYEAAEAIQNEIKRRK